MQPVRPSPCQSVMRPVHPSSCHLHQPVNRPIHTLHCQSIIRTHLSVAQPIHQFVNQPISQSHCLSITRPVHLSYNQSIHHPVNSSMPHQSVTPPISPAICPSDHPSPSDCLYTILPHLSGSPTSSDCSSTIYTSLSDHPSLPDCLYDKPLSPSDHLSLSLSYLPSTHDHLYDDPPSLSACPSPSNSLPATTTCPTVRLSSHTIHRTQDSSQSIAVVNGEQSCKAKQFHRAFTNYDLLLRALDVSSIYLSDS